jgi:hypothetical protein
VRLLMRARSVDAYAWLAVLGLGVVIRVGTLWALPELFAGRTTLLVAAVHIASDLVTMGLVRRIAIAIAGSSPIGTLAAAGVALHPHLVFETLSERDTAFVVLGLHVVVWLIVTWNAAAPRRLAASAALVAGLAGGMAVTWAWRDARQAAARAELARRAASRPPAVEGDDRAPSGGATVDVDPLIDYGRALQRIYGGVAAVLAVGGVIVLRRRSGPAVALLVIVPLAATCAGLLLPDPARARLPGEPLLLVLSAAGLAALALWWSPKATPPGQTSVESPDHGLEWPPVD